MASVLFRKYVTWSIQSFMVAIRGEMLRPLGEIIALDLPHVVRQRTGKEARDRNIARE